MGKPIRVFVSYSREESQHNDWVVSFVDKLRADGVDAHVDRYDLQPGDRLTKFMEEEIANSDYVLIVCTPKYKEKADRREKGVGYEGHIISGELMQGNNERKFIPVIRKGSVLNSLPIFLNTKLAIDLSGDDNFVAEYNDLIATLYGQTKKPPLGKRPDFVQESSKLIGNDNIENQVRILGIITSEVTVPRNDGTRGSALYRVPFKLSKTPSQRWAEFFLNAWEFPPEFTTMHRPGIASVRGDRILLDGTTIDEVKEYHRNTLLLCVAKANEQERDILEREERLRLQREKILEEHRENVDRVSQEMEW